MSSPYSDEREFSRRDEEDGGAGVPAFLLDPRGVVERRWPWMLGCALFGLLATAVGVALSTPMYRAEADILISSQQIPEEFVRSTVREDTIANINSMVGRVISDSNLTRLVDEFDLFGGPDRDMSLSAQVKQVRAGIEIGPTSKSRRRARGETSLVYGIAFTYSDPEVAAAVANELSSYFIEASLARRQASAKRATEFLQRELERDEAALAIQSREVTEFRQEHRGLLPNELETSLRKLENLTREKDSLNAQIAQRQNRLLELASAPQAMVTTANQELLSALRRQLAAELAANTEEHPNVVALRRRVASQEQAVADERNSATGEGTEIAALRRAEQADLTIVRNRLSDVEAALIELNSRIERMPRVAEELATLEHRQGVLREDYLDTLRKVKEAELAESLESAQQGGQVTVLDRAYPPGAPVQPAWFLLVGGLVGSVFLALAAAVLLELIDPVIVSSDQLERISERSVLGSLPEIA